MNSDIEPWMKHSAFVHYCYIGSTLLLYLCSHKVGRLLMRLGVALRRWISPELASKLFLWTLKLALWEPAWLIWARRQKEQGVGSRITQSNK